MQPGTCATAESRIPTRTNAPLLRFRAESAASRTPIGAVPSPSPQAAPRIVTQTDHFALLDSREVYLQVRDWLRPA